MTDTPLFSSPRERRLWICTLAVVVAIYATLGLASTLVGILLERGVFDQVFVVAFFLIGAPLLLALLDDAEPLVPHP